MLEACQGLSWHCRKILLRKRLAGFFYPMRVFLGQILCILCICFYWRSCLCFRYWRILLKCIKHCKNQYDHMPMLYRDPFLCLALYFTICLTYPRFRHLYFLVHELCPISWPPFTWNNGWRWLSWGPFDPRYCYLRRSLSLMEDKVYYIHSLLTIPWGFRWSHSIIQGAYGLFYWYSPIMYGTWRIILLFS